MDQNPQNHISPTVSPNDPPTSHTETPADDGRANSEATTSRLDSLDIAGLASDNGTAPDLVATQAPTSTEPDTPPENPDGTEGQSIGADLSDSPSESKENTSKPQGPNATATEGPKKRKARNSGTAPASAASPHQKHENYESSFPIKKIKILIGELPELSAPLISLAKFRTEHTYVARLTSALHRDALSLMMLMFPIIVATTAKVPRVVAGSRTLAIAKTEQHPKTKITAIEIGEIDDHTTRMLAVVDSFICGLYFCLSKGSMKLLQDAYSNLEAEYQNIAEQLLPGATTKQDLAKLTALREPTIYDRRKSKGDPTEKSTKDQEKGEPAEKPAEDQEKGDE
jgi:hypothetical protein